MNRPYNVLFLCTGNSARSILAEAIMNREAIGKFKGYSAGSMPKGEVHPYTLDLLGNLNYDTSKFRSKSWEEFSKPGAPELDFVFTVCDNAANEACPLWPGQPMTAHWGFADPAAFEGPEAEALACFKDIFLQIGRRIDIFCNLRLEALDRLAIKGEIDRIGRE
jgi:protein-tyrosine-phosphatase